MRQATEMRGNIIALTSDPALKQRLQAKLADYAQRHAAVAAAPERDPDTVYKFRLLDELLSKHIVDADAWGREFAKYPWYSAKIYENAVQVIRTYNSGSTYGLSGGSGLR